MAVILGGVELPDDLAWPDRYDWQPVTVNTQYSLTGALLVESSTKLAGRPITLQSANNRSWVTRAVVESLKDLQAVAGHPQPNQSYLPNHQKELGRKASI